MKVKLLHLVVLMALLASIAVPLVSFQNVLADAYSQTEYSDEKGVGSSGDYTQGYGEHFTSFP